MDHDKLKRRLEQQTARDHTHMRRWADRKLRRYEKTMNEPLLSKFCTLTFLCMVAGTCLTVTGDVHMFYVYQLSGGDFLRNAAFSAFCFWTCFAVLLFPAATVQLRRGFDDPYFQTKRLTRRGRPRMPLRTRFRIYQLSALIGTMLFSLLLILSSLG